MGAIGRDRNREKLGIGVASPNVEQGKRELSLDLGAIKVEVLQPTYGAPSTPYSPNTGSGIAIAGMGVMRYLRLTFDLRTGYLYASTGTAYDALVKLGADIEQGPQGPTVSRVVEKGAAEVAGLKEGDIVTGINGEAVSSSDEALSRVVSYTGFYCHLKVLRNNRTRHIMIDVARPSTKNQRW